MATHRCPTLSPAPSQPTPIPTRRPPHRCPPATAGMHLYLRPDQLEPWQQAVRKLAQVHGTDNTTDTVLAVVLSAAGA